MVVVVHKVVGLVVHMVVGHMEVVDLVDHMVVGHMEVADLVDHMEVVGRVDRMGLDQVDHMVVVLVGHMEVDRILADRKVVVDLEKKFKQCVGEQPESYLKTAAAKESREVLGFSGFSFPNHMANLLPMQRCPGKKGEIIDKRLRMTFQPSLKFDWGHIFP